MYSIPKVKLKRKEKYSENVQVYYVQFDCVYCREICRVSLRFVFVFPVS